MVTEIEMHKARANRPLAHPTDDPGRAPDPLTHLATTGCQRHLGSPAGGCVRPQVECLHHEWIRDTLDHYYEASDRYIYVAHTNTGLIGLGEGGGPDTADLIEQCARPPFVPPLPARPR